MDKSNPIQDELKAEENTTIEPASHIKREVANALQDTEWKQHPGGG